MEGRTRRALSVCRSANNELRLDDDASDPGLGAERVADLKELRRSFNIMDWWMGLAPNGSPMVLRDTSIEEIDALEWREP